MDRKEYPEDPETKPHSYSHLILDEEAKDIH
jgi:hypothetical protein